MHSSVSPPSAVQSGGGNVFTDHQLRDLEIAERSMSCLSLMGSLFIMTTFGVWPTFRKPINRLVFLASIGNLLCNIATLISVSGTMYGAKNPLCQFQAFLIQMFIPADSLWTFCMALNVYLTFFKNYDSAMLRSLEKWYFLACYGTPLLPALIFLIIDHASKGARIYGPATLWCWIAVEWDWMRIAFFYGPVWIIIAVTTTIYLVTGKDIFKQRAALRAFSKDQPRPPMPIPVNPFMSEGLAVRKVTEIQITHETIRPQSPDYQAKSLESEDGTRSSFASTRKLSHKPTHNLTNGTSPFTRLANDPWPYTEGATGELPGENNPNFSTTVTAGRSPQQTETERQEEDTQPTKREARVAKRELKAHRKKSAAARHANSAAWGYAKVSMLMFLALFVVWVPSTINRVYSLVRPQEPSFALSLLAGLVLPLQGFWNAVIYIITSWGQCKDAFHSIFSRYWRSRSTRVATRHGGFASPFHKRMPVLTESIHDLHRYNDRGLDHSFDDESTSTPDRSLHDPLTRREDIELDTPVSYSGSEAQR
ncbi:family A G protein-coupled receptor-like protein [Pseudovirgaria hyperparasitica]|uniref:Family A G protein-coupled receptor-like protein n=1 Tax=Pseudovirgaria hyperparasitica TaxID=470096 RepID=A0A6A6W1D8_9PEZI|nr:family A G protein-coupled receptor-like protein [Pseudovirgaria hyperparasitica]KAF2756345.1 family A G protein-coupled receptor-like protein [Pseudovirgaria hyperparasitica]